MRWLEDGDHYFSIQIINAQFLLYLLIVWGIALLRCNGMIEQPLTFFSYNIMKKYRTGDFRFT